MKEYPDMHKSEKLFPAMGTIISLAAYGMGAEKVLNAAQSTVESLDRLLSHTRGDSEISRLNSASGGEWLRVQDDTAACLNEATRCAETTGGTFDPALGVLIDLWAAARKKKRIPAQYQIERALDSGGFRSIERGGAGRFRLANGAKLNLGGIGKGYAADQICALCRSESVSSALFSLGTSSITALGVKPDGSPWKVGLRAVDGGNGVCFGTVRISGRFLSTSGDYEDFDVIDGRRCHHILDTNTGYPADSGLRSVTIIADSGVVSEAYSTALFVMGLERALEFHRRAGGFEGIFVTSDRRVHCTPGAREVFEFSGPELGYRYEA
ncbi:MAG: FAD:protein FMN transferase [Clostridiales Family XIII bacterium]|jgi:thiamine biosynthesis lipoprotein|nr:FAD:protein FMN transferase [Clostridiales Family XIII bacterium]